MFPQGRIEARTAEIKEKRAKLAALAHINATRVADGFAPLKRIEKLWWNIHGAEWIARQE